MHMADALISPLVGGTMMAATTTAAAYSIKKVHNEMDEKKIPLMGVMGAFIFAAQMINFSIPGTGSSGHLGGGLLLAIMLGPYGGFLTMASILLIQALLFGDGGLLAYGCNVFNLGFYTCFIAYPLIYKSFIKKAVSSGRILIASLISSVLGLQMGSLSVVLEAVLSGKTELPFKTFVMFMQPIHLAIGVIEGFVTAAVVTFIWNSRPEILEKAASGEKLGAVSLKKTLIGLCVSVLIIGGCLSWFASSNPDGLEWSIFKTSGKPEIETSDGIHKTMSKVQSKTAVLPDYGFKTKDEKAADENAAKNESQSQNSSDWGSVNTGTSFSGIVGGAVTLGFVVLVGFVASILNKRKINLKSRI
ncbi:energy-coupling factor ABC transporter permease [Pseudobacteroides cellulosolvens]|uniref:Cobalamin (Vitamin B12) biosynthesis CbiM protein n=1 Tax=Pseudobacteroides cellulosolvens ATCC 35603 = DSM 2933 TaxID=398512 RepID=A0A0L6JUB0_9FIRM|nr:energy-coupling factor ABC transporter permease [Pseudobacteroides cellulosolvens]KNY29304.1 cobalamin (vitamin B12) biosynthesis CbiM protein [Pseudobacteroides cellulosolvens ATCC 35603 = DSM 2933]